MIDRQVINSKVSRTGATARPAIAMDENEAIDPSIQAAAVSGR